MVINNNDNNNNDNNNNEKRRVPMNLVNEGVLPPDELDDRDERREEQESARRRETVADIVADIRERAENAMRNGERLVHNEAVANMLTFVADRIEAAWKRERDEMLGALVRIGNWCALDLCEDAYGGDTSGNYLKTLNGLCEICRPFMAQAAEREGEGDE